MTFKDGYQQAFQDIANLLEHTRGCAGPGSTFGDEAEAGVACIWYVLEYKRFEEINLGPEYSVQDFIRIDLLER